MVGLSILAMLCCGAGTWAVGRLVTSVGDGGDGLSEIDDQRPAQVVVRVLDAAGRPLAGARIDAVPEAPWGDGMMRDFDPVAAPAPSSQASTGPDGSATLTGLGSGTWWIRASARGAASRSRPVEGGHAARHAVDLRLGPGHALRGRVADSEGRAVTDAVVLATELDDRHFTPATPLASSRAVCRGDGAYSFEDLPSGIVALWVARPGDIPSEAGRVLVPACADLDLEVPTQRTLVGRVVGPGGNGVADAGVRIQLMAGDALLRATTGADGTFTLAYTPPPDGDFGSVFQSSVRADGWSACEEGDRELPGGSDARPFTLHVQPGGSVSGTVTGPEGPIAGATVRPDYPTRLFVATGEKRRSARTDAAGRFRLDGLPVGGFALRARVGDRVGTADVVVRAGETTDVALLLPPDATPRTTVRGTVTGAGGGPIDGARVELLHHGEYGEDETLAWTSSRADGSFDLPGIPADASLALRFTAAGHRPATTPWQDVTALAGPTVHALVPASALRGTVGSAAGAALRDARVWVVAPRRDGTKPDAISVLWAGCPMWFHETPEVAVRADGSFVATMSGDTGESLVFAWAEGFAPTLAGPFPAGAAVADVLLDPGVTLRGRLLDSAGAPLARRVVTMLAPGFSDVFRVAAATTDAEGRFAVPGLPRGIVRVGVRDGSSFRDVAPSAEELEIRLPARAASDTADGDDAR